MQQLTRLISGLTLLLGFGAFSKAAETTATKAGDDKPSRPPNVVFILTDDLGYAELGCYGQQKIRTPHIDRLAAEGTRFTQFYSGSPVCAPTRATLLTGLHTGHAPVRDNHEVKPEGQYPIPADTVTLSSLLKRRGYTTACVGKWGLGGPGSTGAPERHGFDHFFGHLCQRVAHNQYTTHLWRDGRRVVLEGNEQGNLVGEHYTPDLMADDAVQFIRERKADEPFFLYFATPLPHLALQAPADAIAAYEGQFEETPYDGTKGYLPHPTPRAAYAAMVTRIDDYVGRIMATLTERGFDENTVVFFASDNGPTFKLGGADSEFFDSAGPFRGLKTEVYEGGIRVPFIARWPGKVPAGKTSEHVGAIWDVMPTVLELAGQPVPSDLKLDGVSLTPTLLNQGDQPKHAYLYWEFHAKGGSQAVRLGDWKGVRRGVKKDADAPIELYDLKADVGETTDVAKQHPEVVQRIRTIMSEARTQPENERWHF